MWNSYIALIGEPAALDRLVDQRLLALLAESGLIARASMPMVRLYAATTLKVDASPNKDALVIGRLNRRNGAPLALWDRGSAGVADAIARGTRFVDDYWGSYVAIADGPRRSINVLRDPSVALPCYHVRHGDCVVVTSDCRLLVRLGLLRPAVDGSALARFLVAGSLRGAHSAIEGVEEVMPGCRLTLSGRQTDSATIWSPWPFAERSAQVEDFDDAARQLRATIRSAVAAQVAGDEPLLLSLSGGLDSSIVAASLIETGARFTAVTFATRQKSGDERGFARQLRDRLGFDLIEAEDRIDHVDLASSSAEHLPRPCARAFAQSADRQMERIASALGSHAYIHGGGGDNVFAYLRSATPVADALLSGGIVRGARTAADIARLAECGWGQAAISGAKRAWLRPPHYRWPMTPHFLSRAARAVPLSFGPWLDAPRDAMPGKALQIAFTLGIWNYLEGFRRERDAPNIAPLLAQPVLELCLRIPTWLSCRGGTNRAVARAAFHDILPPAIVQRTSKGTPGSLVLELVEQRAAEIRPMLFDGELSRLGLVDRAAIGAALDDRVIGDVAANRLMALVDAEAWARSWKPS